MQTRVRPINMAAELALALAELELPVAPGPAAQEGRVALPAQELSPVERELNPVEAEPRPEAVVIR